MRVDLLAASGLLSSDFEVRFTSVCKNKTFVGILCFLSLQSRCKGLEVWLVDNPEGWEGPALDFQRVRGISK